MEKEFIKDIERILSQEIQEQSQASDLAFLSLTSKIEQNFRDRIAVSLFQKYSENYKISREYDRCDLAILDKENNLLLIIEFKACYSFDLIKKNKSEEYIEAVRRDMGKSQKKYPDIPMYSILFVTHPLTSIGNRFPGIIKYRNGINKYLMFNKETEIIKNAVLKLKSSFSGVQFRSIIENDFALEQSVSLFYGLIKKQ